MAFIAHLRSNMRINQELDNYLKDFFGVRYPLFLAAENEPRAIRVNTLKTTTRDFEKILRKLNYTFQKIPYQKSGYVISDDPAPLSHTLVYFQGLFMYQGLSSQLPVTVLDIKPGQCVLDIAAAPGSKSTQLAGMMANKGFLVLNDFSTKRLQALSVNMQRTGAVNFCILRHRGEVLGTLMPEFFDRVLCDVPCSALGTLAANPEIYNWWSIKRLSKLVQIQYYLLVSAVKALRVGGELVYSTCTITPEENEIIIDRLLKNYPVEIISPPGGLSGQFSPGLTAYRNLSFVPSLRSAIRIYPDQHQMEGFFIIKLKKTAPLIRNSHPDTSAWNETYSANHPDIAGILGELSEIWGIPGGEWNKYRFYLTKTRIWMVYGKMKKIPLNGFVSAGLLLAEKRISGWKLVHGSIQYFSHFISKRKLELGKENLRKLFKTGSVEYPGVENGYYVLAVQDEPIASLFAESGRLRIRLPHSFNLVL